MGSRIENEFVPYKQALALKELGFDEPCFATWSGETLDMSLQIPSDDYFTKASTFSQAFRFFREKYGLYYYIVPEFYMDGINFNWQILWYLPKEEWTHYVISTGTMMYGDNGEYPTQEEAELACLNKLISIVEQQKQK